MSDDTRERSGRSPRDASAPPNGSDGNQTMFQSDGHLDAEMVSAWLDTPDDFSADDRLAIERHLADCAECRQTAAELTAIVRAFHALPLVETARSFALTPEMAGLTATPTLPSSRRLEEPAHPHERRLERASRMPVELSSRERRFERQMSALRWATAIASLLFVFFVSVDVLGNIDTSGDDDDSASVDMAAQPEIVTESAGAVTTPTTSSAAALMQATTVPEDSARNADQQPTPASAPGNESSGGSQPQATAASGATGATAAEEATGSKATPASASAEPTAESATAMTQVEPTESIQGYGGEQPTTTSPYSGATATNATQESSTLHLIELALVILIAWLIVALIALPRLRRPTG